MQNAQNTHGISANAVCNNERRSLDDKLAGAFDPSWTATLGETCQPFNLRLNPLINSDCGLRAVGLNVIEDRVAVGLRVGGPLQAYHSANFAKRSGAASGEMCFHLFMGNARTRIIERLLHFGAEPGIVRGIA